MFVCPLNGGNFSQYIRDRNGHYLFVVKDNQRTLKAGIAEAFGDHPPL